MAVLFVSFWTELLVVASALLLIYYVYFRIVASKWWQKYNVPHLEPVFLVGNLWRGLVLENFGFTLADIHRKWKDKKLAGLWNLVSPGVLVTDLDLIKNVLTRDFAYFRDRGLPDFDHDPLAANLFNLSGAKWRNLRVRMTPTFTSGKMKMMFQTMVECGEELQEFLQKKAAVGDGEVEVKEVLSCFTTDVIASCAFGIRTNSLKNPDGDFRKFGRKMTSPTLAAMIRGVFFMSCPHLFKALKLPVIPKDVSDFFVGAVRDTMESREKNRIRRNDFMQLLIELKNKGKLEDVDWIIPSGLDENEVVDEDLKFTFVEAAAQAFVFFVAGFETTSATLSFALYELALNADIQETLQEEIDGVLEKHGGKLTYEAVTEMELLDRVVQETLRKYPPAPLIFRQCNKDYEIPEMGAKIPKGRGVTISVLGIHRDPELYPNPERFDPNRFLPEEKAKRHNFSYLPFGEGPRMCIGNRFALLQAKVGLVSFLSRHKVEVCAGTPIPIQYVKNFFMLVSKSGMPLRVVPRRRTTDS